MFLLDLKRTIRSGFTNFRRNGIVSIASILVMTVTLSVITSLIFLQVILHFSLSEIENKVDVTVYFNVGTPEGNILTLKSSLDRLPEVASSVYISSEEALENFRERHKDDYLTLQALEELDENPLGASLNIKAMEVSQYESIANFLESDNALEQNNVMIIDKVNYFQNKVIIDRLNSLIDGARSLGLILTLVLIVISIAIVFNTIRLTIYISREEIKIMRLVGAANSYIRGPFMVEGIIYGLIASVLTMLIFYPLTLWLGNNMAGFFGINMFSYFTANFSQILIIIVLTGTLVGAASSFLAIRRYLVK